MQSSGLSNFRKLYGKINQDIPKGNYTFFMSNNGIFLNSEFENYDFPFKKRHIIITTSTFLGGENNIIMFYSLILSVFMMLTNFLFFKRSETFKISNKSLLNL